MVREGLNDRSEKVQEACTKMICESWADEQLLTYFAVLENEVSFGSHFVCVHALVCLFVRAS